MAVLVGISVIQAEGGYDNPNVTSAHDSFAWVTMPYEADTHSLVLSGPVVSTLPVEANGRFASGMRLGSYVDDFYYRVHINPAQLDLGNVVSTQTTAVSLWNAFLEPRTLGSIEGLQEGLLVSGQPVPPLLFPALKELEWQISVTPDGQPVLDTTVTWVFDNGAEAGLRITANRIIAWSFAPDWGDGIIERLTSATDILQSESAAEQRRGLLLAPRREFEAPMFVEGRERQLLDLALFGWGSRVWALPIWHDIQLLEVAVPVEAMTISCSTEYLDFRDGGLAMLRGENAFASETVEIDFVTLGGLQLKRPTQQAWPVGSRLYPVRSAQLLAQPSLSRLTDMAIQADVHFLVVEPCDWPEIMPSTLYRGRPVYEARPDESNDLTSTLSRLLLTLDNGSAIPLFTDTASRGFAVLGHRWLELGRAERAALRSFIYAMNGQQKAVWVPTHADDLTLAEQISAVATVIDVAYAGYTRFASGKPGRRDIRIELHDGSVYYRRITGSTELGTDIERLAIDAAFGRLILPGDVMRISWMACCRFNGDSIEIEHQTDSEGVAACSLVFKEVRDDEF